MNKWTLEQAQSLCIVIEGICPQFGCHVALTGGCLYKLGERKDMDLIFYRIRQVKSINVKGLLEALEIVGLTSFCGGGWRYVAKYHGKSIDLLFPEDGKSDDTYEPGIPAKRI